MRGLPRPSAADEEYLRRSLAAGGQGYVAEMEDAARAWLALMAAEVAPGPLIAVVESALALDLLAQDIGTLSGREHVLRLPALNVETSRLVSGQPSPDISGERLQALQHCLTWKGQGILVTCVQALLEKVPAPSRMQRLAQRVAVGQEYDLDNLCEQLVAAGYEFDV